MSDWDELRAYAEQLGYDFDQLVAQAAEVVSGPLSMPGPLSDEDITRIVSDEMAFD